MRGLAGKWFWVVILVLVILVSCNVYIRASNYQSIDHVAGTWAALAQDVADGILYRPFMSDRGFGGTRYMPLFFILHGGGLRLGLTPVHAGFLLNAVILIGLLAGVYGLLRQIGADPGMAAFGALLVIASDVFLQLMTTIRGDALPLALGIWGLVLSMDNRSGPGRLIGAACLFSLAFFAKFTALAAPGAAVLALWFQGRKKHAVWLTGLTVIWSLIFIGVLQAFSSGRFIEIMQVCALGGTNKNSMLMSVYRMLNHLDYPGLLMLFLGLGAWFLHVKDEPLGMPSIFFVFTSIVTIIIFAGPGTTANHLLDIFVASIVITVGWMLGQNGKMIKTGMVFLALIGLFGVESHMEKIVEHVIHPRDRRSVYMELVKQTKTGNGIILSENPTIPVFAGQVPYLSDPFMFNLLSARYPDLKTRLSSQIQNKEFESVVLWDRQGRETCGSCLDMDLVEQVMAQYDLKYETDRFWIFLPKP
jgi:hypothetical protein